MGGEGWTHWESVVREGRDSVQCCVCVCGCRQDIVCCVLSVIISVGGSRCGLLLCG